MSSFSSAALSTLSTMEAVQLSKASSASSSSSSASLYEPCAMPGTLQEGEARQCALLHSQKLPCRPSVQGDSYQNT